jgi:hypothetical protein
MRFRIGGQRVAGVQFPALFECLDAGGVLGYLYFRLDNNFLGYHSFHLNFSWILAPSMDTGLLKFLVRSYYFAEAMAFYELYYRPLISTYKPAREKLRDPGRKTDRPPTWVPIVFHCTNLDRAAQIFESGFLEPGKNGYISFTEIPIGELDRMKWRKAAEDQIAIGFPRRFIESIGFAPVLYLKHHPLLGNALKEMNSDIRDALIPFVEPDDDVAPFQEIRTRTRVPIVQAIWILSTKLKDEPPRPEVPGLDIFKKKYGKIAQSYWHATHQLGLLHEWQFTQTIRNQQGELTQFQFIGEHYWRQEVLKERNIKITLPKHERDLIFTATNLKAHSEYQGPWTFIDVAGLISRLIAEQGNPMDELLKYRLIKDVNAI